MKTYEIHKLIEDLGGGQKKYQIVKKMKDINEWFKYISQLPRLKEGSQHARLVEIENGSCNTVISEFYFYFQKK